MSALSFCSRSQVPSAECYEYDILYASFFVKKKLNLSIPPYFSDMKETAADDREANAKNKPAIHKLKMSKLVFSQLMKKDLHDMFLDGGVLSGRSFLPNPIFLSLANLSVREYRND